MRVLFANCEGIFSPHLLFSLLGYLMCEKSMESYLSLLALSSFIEVFTCCTTWSFPLLVVDKDSKVFASR